MHGKLLVITAKSVDGEALSTPVLSCGSQNEVLVTTERTNLKIWLLLLVSQCLDKKV